VLEKEEYLRPHGAESFIASPPLEQFPNAHSYMKTGVFCRSIKAGKRDLAAMTDILGEILRDKVVGSCEKILNDRFSLPAVSVVVEFIGLFKFSR